ncbi:unnamed protein product [Rotaria sp. Silwood1]|nr:unnamed protein product [Rotaria sp. Silwood1]
MTNIAQRKSICMAIWWLTCLMLSACSSLTIADALFSLTLSRFSAHFEELDNHLFLIADQVLNNNGLLNNNTLSDSNEFDANNISPINDELHDNNILSDIDFLANNNELEDIK